MRAIPLDFLISISSADTGCDSSLRGVTVPEQASSGSGSWSAPWLRHALFQTAPSLLGCAAITAPVVLDGSLHLFSFGGVVGHGSGGQSVSIEMTT